MVYSRNTMLRAATLLELKAMKTALWDDFSSCCKFGPFILHPVSFPQLLTEGT